MYEKLTMGYSPPHRFKVEIDLHNEAFSQGPTCEIVRILTDLALRVSGGETKGLIRDINGNAVGNFRTD